MGCLLAFLAMLSPRFVVALLWIFTDRLTIAFDSGWAGIAGFLFLPYTTAMYALAYAPLRGVTGIGWLLVGIAVLIDLGSWLGGGREGKNRYA
jgi:hypothetical protein